MGNASVVDTSSNSKAGVILVLLASALFGLSGVFTKLISADAWTILTWRGLAGGLTILAYRALSSAPEGALTRKSAGLSLLLLSLVGTLSSITFIAAFKHTYVANVTVIYALVPFVSALLEWALLREPVRMPTLVAAFVSFVGVGILGAGAIGSGHGYGDMLAVMMMLLNAAYAVLIRMLKRADVMLAGAVASFLVFAFGLLIAKTTAMSWVMLGVTAIFGVSFGLASILWTEGAKRIPAAEVGVLSSADIPIAILFAWLLVGEVPPLASLLGAAIVVAAVVYYSRWKASSQ